MNDIRFDRREFKFTIDAEQRREISTVLHEQMQVDPHGDAEGRYPIVSVYYDSAGLDLYLAAANRRRSRRKLRLRVYGDEHTRASTASFVEVKHRYRVRVAKRRIALSIDEGLALGRGRLPAQLQTESDRLVAEEVRGMVRQLQLRPVCVMRYDRQAFRGLGGEADLRITFDEQIRVRGRDLVPSAGDRDFDLDILEPGQSVLEIKVAERVPYWLAHLVGRTGCVRRSFSKYQSAVMDLGLQPAAADPEPLSAAARATALPRLDAVESSWTP